MWAHVTDMLQISNYLVYFYLISRLITCRTDNLVPYTYYAPSTSASWTTGGWLIYRCQRAP